MNIQKVAIGVACLLCVQGMSAITTTRYNQLVNKFAKRINKKFGELEDRDFEKMQKYINELNTAKKQPDILHKAQELHKQMELKKVAWKQFTAEERGGEKDNIITALRQELEVTKSFVNDLKRELEALKAKLPSNL